MKQSIAWTGVLSFAGAIALTIIGVLFIRPFMHLLHTPEGIFEDAYSYIIVIVSGLMATAFYNLLSNILRAIGNSVIPLVFLIISAFLNIILDLAFILIFGMGLPGAAIATVISEVFSGVLCFIYILKKVPAMRLSRKDFRPDGNLISSLLCSGFAMMLMYAVVNIGTVILQSGINGLGQETIAAHVAARKISEIFMMASGVLSSTMATFAGQNYGAGRMDRVWEGLKKTSVMGVIWSLAVIITSWFFAAPILKALTGSSDMNVIRTGQLYLRINSPFYFFLMPLCIVRSTLQGIGSRFLPVISSTVEMLGKVVCTALFIPYFGYMAVCFCEPLTWIVCSIIVLSALFARKDMREVMRGSGRKVRSYRMASRQVN